MQSDASRARASRGPLPPPDTFRTLAYESFASAYTLRDSNRKVALWISDQRGRVREQILVLLENVAPSQIVSRIRDDAQIFERHAGVRTNAQHSTRRHTQIAPA